MWFTKPVTEVTRRDGWMSETIREKLQINNKLLQIRRQKQIVETC